MHRHVVTEVDCVAAAGHVDVGAVLVLAVVVRIVDPAEARPGAAESLLGSVVVDDVEDDFEAGLVQELDHPLELGEHRIRTRSLCCARSVGRMRREEVQGVVAPVVREALVDQPLLGEERLHRQELDRGHPEFPQVAGGGLVCEPRVRAAQLFGDVGVELADAPDVRLVDDGVVERDLRFAGVGPVEAVLDDVGEPSVRSRVHETPRVRVDQHGLRVERIRRARGPRDADRVAPPWRERPRPADPDVVRILCHLNCLHEPVRIFLVEQAQFHPVGVFRPDAQLAPVGGDADAEIAQGIGRSHAI